MKAAVLGIALLFALSSYAYAVLRPRVPHRTMPPVGAQPALHETLAESAVKLAASGR